MRAWIARSWSSCGPDGHDVTYIAEPSPSIPDDEVLREANERGAVLATADKDFGELVFRLGKLSSGVLLIRLHGPPDA